MIQSSIAAAQSDIECAKQALQQAQLVRQHEEEYEVGSGCACERQTCRQYKDLQEHQLDALACFVSSVHWLNTSALRAG